MEQQNVRIGLIQMAVGPDPNENLKKALSKVELAAEEGSQIICLPELYRTRYFPQGIGVHASPLAETIPGDSTRVFSEIARRNNVVIIVPIFEKSSDGRYYNTAVIALTAPMPGKILSVEVNRGDRVSRGQTLVTLEAMKMKNAIKSPYDGVVLEIEVRPEQTVAHGDLLVQLGEE